MVQLKAQAEDQTRLKASEAQLAQKKVDFKKTEAAFKDGAATPLEVDHARLGAVVVKSLVRASQGTPRYLATPRNLARCFLGRTHNVPRATEGTQIGHIGFNHFHLARRFDDGLDADRIEVHRSPMQALPWWLNSQVFWVYRRRSVR